jgi:hypothetical protein
MKMGCEECTFARYLRSHFSSDTPSLASLLHCVVARHDRVSRARASLKHDRRIDVLRWAGFDQALGNGVSDTPRASPEFA